MSIPPFAKTALVRFLGWGLGLLAVLALIGLDRHGASLRIDDRAMTRDGAFDIVSLAPYSAHGASFTRQPGAALTYRLSQPATIVAFSLRSYNYGDGVNRFAVSFDGGPATTVEMRQGPEGQQALRHQLSAPQRISTIRIAAEQIGQSTALIDHIELETGGFPTARLLDLAMLAFALAAALAFAPRALVVHAPSSGRSLLFIDYMRGLGALLVLLHHARGYTQLPDFPGAPWFGVLAKKGHLGVELFYFVSAYTLTLSLLASHADGGRPSGVIDFWLRRLARIMPAFLFVMLLMVATRPIMYLEAQQGVTVGLILRHVFMTYVFNDVALNAIIQHSAWWSISTELQFYCLLPAFASAAWLSIARTGRLPWTRRALAGAGLFLFGVALSAVARKAFAGASWSPYMALYHFDVFAGGIGLAVVMNGRAARKTAPARGPARIFLTAAWISLLLLIVSLFDAYGGMAAFRPLGAQLLDELGWRRAGLAAGLGLTLVVADWTERHHAASPESPLRAIGVLSFIIYLLHIPALQIVQRHLIPSSFAGAEQAYVAAIPLALLLCVVFGLVIHRAIEAPGMDVVRNPAFRPTLRIATHIYVVVMITLFYLSL